MRCRAFGRHQVHVAIQASLRDCSYGSVQAGQLARFLLAKIPCGVGCEFGTYSTSLFRIRTTIVAHTARILPVHLVWLVLLLLLLHQGRALLMMVVRSRICHKPVHTSQQALNIIGVLS